VLTWKTVALVAALAAALGVLVLALLSVLSRRPANLGDADGRLAPCPDTPNCVSTRAADEAHRIDPLAYDGSAEDAMARLRAVLGDLPRTRVVTATDTYMHAECRSLVFRFVDDVEFLLDGREKVIHFRSASRAGRSDLGVNRRRMEAIRQAFNERARSTTP
jgi:uncharacterized protein (DUF1499 family)